MKFSKYNLLQSFEVGREQAKHLTKDRRNELKKVSKEAMIHASSKCRLNKLEHANTALAFAVDCLSMIRPLDRQTKELLRACYEQIAWVYKVSKDQKEDELFRKKYTMYLAEQQKKDELILDFDREQGIFNMTEVEELYFDYDLRFMLSKLNHVLFTFNNQEAAESFFSKIKVYRPSLLLSIILFVITFFIFFSQGLFLSSQSFLNNMVVNIISACFIFPLLMIYFRNPQLQVIRSFREDILKEVGLINHQLEVEQVSIRFEFLDTNQLRIYRLKNDQHHKISVSKTNDDLIHFMR